jgi:hypothetical protein
MEWNKGLCVAFTLISWFSIKKKESNGNLYLNNVFQRYLPSDLETLPGQPPLHKTQRFPGLVVRHPSDHHHSQLWRTQVSFWPVPFPSPNNNCPGPQKPTVPPPLVRLSLAVYTSRSSCRLYGWGTTVSSMRRCWRCCERSSCIGYLSGIYIVYSTSRAHLRSRARKITRARANSIFVQTNRHTRIY